MSLRNFIAGVRSLQRFSEALEQRRPPAPLSGVIDMREIAPGVFVPPKRQPVRQVSARALVELEQGTIGVMRAVRDDFRAMKGAHASRSRKR